MRRWHTMPWLVLSFGVLVVPVGFVSIFLVMCQPIIVGAWCDVCLLIALSMLIMLALTVDEVMAVCQYVTQQRKEGRSLKSILFLGSNYEKDGEDNRTPSMDAPVSIFFNAMTWGVTFSWNVVLSAILGVGFLFLNPYFGLSGLVANNAVVMCALIGVMSIISFAEVARAIRFLNIPLALWLIAGSFILPGASLQTGLSAAVVGGLVIVLSSMKGAKIQETYGEWDQYIF